MADRVHGHIHASSRGRLAHALARVILGQVDGHGPELPGHLEPSVDGVDGQHRASAGGQRGLHRAQPDRTQAQDGHAVPGPRPRTGNRPQRGNRSRTGNRPRRCNRSCA